MLELQQPFSLKLNTTMLRLRVFHRYLGVFFMPSILFFAFSGALQTFGLHESKQRGEPPPVAWIAALASVHKDQHLPQAVPRAKLDAPARSPVSPVPEQKRAAAGEKSSLPLKLFTLMMAIGLMVTSLLGMYLALNNQRTRKAAAATLLAGVFAPLVLLLL